ncbi:MAG: dTDP-4-dehydrorhamnose 3,5-epimerase [Oscillospiraceae bacterium]|nr:dTDP-4-dehydrorhamnose 3,5-epimerase [Oscillospiraceae bacterium]
MGKFNITELGICGVKILEPKLFPDNRGFSGEMFSVKDLKECGINYNFVLDYQAFNAKKNTLRGIHFQNNPHPQTKLVRVLRGSILDFVVDLRKDSPSYKKWISHQISFENNKQILIPSGCGHAFITLEDNTNVLYKFDDYYDGKLVRTIRWDDPEINIDWGGRDFIMSDSDRTAVCLAESDVNFNMKENC